MIHDLSAIRAFLDDKHLAMAELIAGAARSQIATRDEPANDEDGRVEARALLALFGDLGWLEHVIDPDLRTFCLLREAIAWASPLADAVFALQGLGSMPLQLGGSDALKAQWLPRVETGEVMAAFGMTEREAGTDVAAMATRAVRDGDEYILNGEKIFISNAGIADFYCVFASSDPDAGHRGLSCFLVEADRPGLRFQKAQHLSAPHPLGEIALEDCRIPVANRLGEEGEGFRLGMGSLDRLRITVGAAACGMASRALHEALEYARQREQFGKSIAENQLIQQKLARSATDLTASRLLVYRAAFEKDTGAERFTLPSAMGKLFATEAAQRIIDDAVQIHGGRGVLAESVVDRLYRAIRPLRIYEGSSEIQHVIIARALLKG